MLVFNVCVPNLLLHDLPCRLPPVPKEALPLHYEAAKAAGAVIVKELYDTAYGSKEYTAKVGHMSPLVRFPHHHVSYCASPFRRSRFLA